MGPSLSVLAPRDLELLHPCGPKLPDHGSEVTNCILTQAQSRIIVSCLGIGEMRSPAATYDGRRPGKRTVFLLGESCLLARIAEHATQDATERGVLSRCGLLSNFLRKEGTSCLSFTKPTCAF